MSRFSYLPSLFLRLHHPLAIPKLPLILGVPRLLAVLFITIFLPIALANEKVSTVAAAHHNVLHKDNL